VATPQFIIHSSLGQADLALAVYLTIAALAAFLWLVDGGDRYAALAGLMAGAASWTKLEGAFTAVVILLAVVVVRRSVRTPGLLPSIAWFAAFVVPWQVFQRLHDISASHRHFSRGPARPG
jgi:4-amino-4-deoxy-L-arabinose transferase-like glycosyltransferase